MRLKRPYVFFVIAIFPLLVISRNLQFHEPLHQISLSVLKPFLQVGHTVANGFETSRDSVVQFWKTFRDQEDYESRILELETRVEKYDELARENTRLAKLLDFKGSLEYKSIGARVIGWDNNPWKKTLILDKGTQQGLSKDMAIVVAQGFVGRIVEIG